VVSLLVPVSASQAADAEGTTPQSATAAAVATEVDPLTVSPMAQSGPRNIIKRLSDTYIKSTDTANHSGEHVLHVGSPDNGATKYRSFMRFDVAKLRGAPISKATLRIYNAYVSDCTADAPMSVAPVTQSWDQATITWANQPTVGTAKETTLGLADSGCTAVPNRTNPEASNGIKRIDVTDWVTAWANDSAFPNHGIRLTASETGSSGYKRFCSMNPLTSDPTCHAAYHAPTLEVEFNEGHRPIITGNAYGPTYPNNYPTAHAALEFFDSTKPSVWTASGPYQRWIPDAYHSVADTTLKGDTWGGGTSHKLRPGGPYGGNVLVTGDGTSGFIGVIPYPSLAGYHWAINVGSSPADLHGVEMLPDGTVVAAYSDRVFAGTTKGGIAVYSRTQGAPGRWNATPAATASLESAHEVLFDPAGQALWAVGGRKLVKYPYVNGVLDLNDPVDYPLPQWDAKDANGNTVTATAWGHEISPVHGNPDRLWVVANAGITQFSKSGATPCHNDVPRWPTRKYVSGATEAHWCNDYAREDTINTRTLVKSVGNDPSTGMVISTCGTGCPEAQTTYPTWTSAKIRFVDTATTSPEAVHLASTTSDRHYRATWAVPAYQ
jgi:hypothetical protein